MPRRRPSTALLNTPCPDRNKIRNPETGICVNREGRIGRRVIEAQRAREAQRSREAAQRSREAGQRAREAQRARTPERRRTPERKSPERKSNERKSPERKSNEDNIIPCANDYDLLGVTNFNDADEVKELGTDYVEIITQNTKY